MLDPALEFNPPVRFLQSSGHKEKLGISYDKTNLTIQFTDAESKKKFKHLIFKLVISPARGMGATATYDKVFNDYKEKTQPKSVSKSFSKTANSSGASNTKLAHESVAIKPSKKLNPGALFSYPVTVSNALIIQLMKEAADINCSKLPASATFLLRNIVEAVLKQIIDDKKANPQGNTLDLERSLNLCRTPAAKLTVTDVKILKEFQDNHLSWLNLGSHANLIPNEHRVLAARDCIDQFVKRNM